MSCDKCNSVKDNCPSCFPGVKIPIGPQGKQGIPGPSGEPLVLPLVYKARIYQESTLDPVVTVVKNDFGTFTWTRLFQGIYIGTLAGYTNQFEGKRIEIISQSYSFSPGDATHISMVVDDLLGTIAVYTKVLNPSIALDDDVLNFSASIILEVYPS